jgi:hypothetical protein
MYRGMRFRTIRLPWLPSPSARWELSLDKGKNQRASGEFFLWRVVRGPNGVSSAGSEREPQSSATAHGLLFAQMTPASGRGGQFGA